MRRYYLFVGCLFSSISSFAMQEAVSSEYVIPVSQKTHRAAFDLGSGTFKLVVAEIDLETQRVNQIHAEKMIHVQLGDDFKKHGTISLEGEARAVKAFEELISLAKQVAGNDVEIRGIATAIFRRAGNRGAEVLSRLNRMIGNSRYIQEASAKMEGEIGLRTAKIVALEAFPERAAPRVAWDSGNGSFQVSYETEKGIEVFAENIGAPDVRHLYWTNILETQEDEIYQPVSEEQIRSFIAQVKEKISAADEQLVQALIRENGRVVTFGDEESLFSSVQSLLGKNVYKKAEFEQFLFSLSHRTHVDDLQAKYPTKISFIVPFTAFLYAVMDKLNIETVENYMTVGSTKGLLVAPELWEKESCQ
jgi:exopolyphosphatase/pppGpp-phosphohydrolase